MGFKPRVVGDEGSKAQMNPLSYAPGQGTFNRNSISYTNLTLHPSNMLSKAGTPVEWLWESS